MKTKVAFVCPRSPRESYGGIEKYTISLAKLIKDSYDIEIFCTAKKPRNNVNYGGLTLREFPETWLPFGIRNYSSKLIRALKKSDAKIIHASGYNTLAPLMGLLSKKPSQKLIINLGGGISTSFMRAIFEIFHTIFLKINSKKINFFIGVSKFEVRRFKKIFSHSSFVLIPNGIEFLANSERKRKSYIVTVSRLVKLKGVHFLVKSFKEVLKKEPKLKLVIIGDGPEKKHLEQQVKELEISKSVLFLGAIPMQKHEKVFEYLLESAVAVFLSSHESYGISAVESIITKTPTIVSDRAALKEFAESGLAVSVDPENTKKVARQILLAYNNQKKYSPSEKKIKACYLIKTWEEVATATMDLYESLLDENFSKKNE
jgi:glycosyltransferase involved in cell wall biosynthesis